MVPDSASDFVRRVTAPHDGGARRRDPGQPDAGRRHLPSGTAVWEKRNVADFVPVWEPDICIQCGQCSFVCPHGVIRAKYYDESRLDGAPGSFSSAPINVRGFPDVRFTLQFYDRGLHRLRPVHRGLPRAQRAGARHQGDQPRDKLPRWTPSATTSPSSSALPVNDRARVDFANVRGVQFLEPLFEFSGACGGCGETPYLKLLSPVVRRPHDGCQRHRMLLDLWRQPAGDAVDENAEGRGPAWSNSLFEDNAEFGLGFRLAADKHLETATMLARRLAPQLGEELVAAVLHAPQIRESEIRAQRAMVAELARRLRALDDADARQLLSVLDYFVRRSVWIVGGDGWAYDIGYGGLDHVLSTARDVNILVLDTEVYSNTGGQASKATPLGAVAKFAAAGKRVARKDLALQAIAYGNVYVAQVAMGGNPQQTLLAFREAEAWRGPSLILAYCHCIAHGIDMQQGLRQQDLAVACGYWPLFRYNPAMREAGANAFRLDSPRPTLKFRDYAYNEVRYKALSQTRPAEAEALLRAAQQAIDEKYRLYEDMAGWAHTRFHPAEPA